MKKMFWVFGLIFSISCSEKQPFHLSEDASETIWIRGSESELPLLNFLCEEYQKKHRKISFEIRGGGSSEGINALIHEKVNLATSSRPLFEEEKDRARESGGELFSFIIARDIVAVIGHPKNGVYDMTLETLAKIYKGEITNWQELGGKDLPIQLHGRDESSGTGYFMLQRMMIESYSPTMKQHHQNKDLAEAIAETPGSIGYITLGQLLDPSGKPRQDIWLINLGFDTHKFYSPMDKTAVNTGDYPLLRPLFLLSRGFPQGCARRFLHFSTTDTIQDHLSSHGYLPINEVQKKINESMGPLAP